MEIKILAAFRGKTGKFENKYKLREILKRNENGDKSFQFLTFKFNKTKMLREFEGKKNSGTFEAKDKRIENGGEMLKMLQKFKRQEINSGKRNKTSDYKK